MLQMLLGITRHPLNRGRAVDALLRFAAWQIGTRLIRGSVAVPFAGDTRLLVKRGMAGATGNVYCGLHEFEDMAFVAHALRSDELFVDVGANIGSYTVLAAGVANARCLSVEPVPSTFRYLLDNVRLNDLSGRVVCHNVALGREHGELRFTAQYDTMNHALEADAAGGDSIAVPVVTLDSLLADQAPAVIKIDVEGFEAAVIAGGQRTLHSHSLLAVLAELNGSGKRYGFNDEDVDREIRAAGFTSACYDPMTRTLREQPEQPRTGMNVLYVRRIPELQARLAASAPIEVLGGHV